MGDLILDTCVMSTFEEVYAITRTNEATLAERSRYKTFPSDPQVMCLEATFTSNFK